VRTRDSWGKSSAESKRAGGNGDDPFFHNKRRATASPKKLIPKCRAEKNPQPKPGLSLTDGSQSSGQFARRCAPSLAGFVVPGREITPLTCGLGSLSPAHSETIPGSTPICVLELETFDGWCWMISCHLTYVTTARWSRVCFQSGCANRLRSEEREMNRVKN
jgi:hypothetical protein